MTVFDYLFISFRDQPTSMWPFVVSSRSTRSSIQRSIIDLTPRLVVSQWDPPSTPKPFDIFTRPKAKGLPWGRTHSFGISSRTHSLVSLLGRSLFNDILITRSPLAYPQRRIQPLASPEGKEHPTYISNHVFMDKGYEIPYTWYGQLPWNEKPTFKNSYLSIRALTNGSLLRFLQFSFYCLYFFIQLMSTSHVALCFHIGGITIATLVNSLKPCSSPPYFSCSPGDPASSSSATLPPSNPSKFRHLILRIM